MNKNSRMILAVSTAGLAPMLQGLNPMTRTAAITMLEEAGIWIGPRGQLETNENFRQVLPYILLQFEDKYVAYSRETAGAENRLHGKLSVGFGGHCEMDDIYIAEGRINIKDVIADTAYREVREEVGHADPRKSSLLGLVVDNETPVGRVHIGFVEIWAIDYLPNAAQVEDGIGNLHLSSLEELWEKRDRLEPWSYAVVDHLLACEHYHF